MPVPATVREGRSSDLASCGTGATTSLTHRRNYSGQTVATCSPGWYYEFTGTAQLENDMKPRPAIKCRHGVQPSKCTEPTCGQCLTPDGPDPCDCAECVYWSTLTKG